MNYKNIIIKVKFIKSNNKNINIIIDILQLDINIIFFVIINSQLNTTFF